MKVGLTGYEGSQGGRGGDPDPLQEEGVRTSAQRSEKVSRKGRPRVRRGEKDEKKGNGGGPGRGD